MQFARFRMSKRRVGNPADLGLKRAEFVIGIRTFEAVFAEDGADFAVEIDFVRGGSGRLSRSEDRQDLEQEHDQEQEHLRGSGQGTE